MAQPPHYWVLGVGLGVDLPSTLPDLSFRETSVGATPTIAILWLGIYPQPLFSLAGGALSNLTSASASSPTIHRASRLRHATTAASSGRAPGLSLAFAASLLSLAGIPLTAGFIAKFYAVASGVDGRHGVLLGTLVAGSIIGLHYYLRMIVTMAAPATAATAATAAADRQAPPESRDRGKPLGHAVLAALVLLLIGLGAYPTPLLTLIRATASMVAR